MRWNLGPSELAMRIVIAAIVLSAGVTLARAADLPVQSESSYSSYTTGIGQRSGQIAFYDYEPGVVVRAYWSAPWRHHHYFPRTGEMPQIGRDEDLSAPSYHYRPAQTFKRSWSNASQFTQVTHVIVAPRAPVREPSDLPPLSGPLK
jgi:hypothetical protein